MEILSQPVRFAYVDCDANEALCGTNGIPSTQPSAVRYEGARQAASWTVIPGGETDTYQLVKWVKSELGKNGIKASSDGETHEAVRLPEDAPMFLGKDSALPLFAELDRESTFVGYALLLAAFATITWVIIEGFELQPAKSFAFIWKT